MWRPRGSDFNIPCDCIKMGFLFFCHSATLSDYMTDLKLTRCGCVFTKLLYIVHTHKITHAFCT